MGGYFLWASLTPTADFEHLKILANLDLNVSLTTFSTVWIIWKVFFERVREGSFQISVGRA